MTCATVVLVASVRRFMIWSKFAPMTEPTFRMSIVVTEKAMAGSVMWMHCWKRFAPSR